ncbi:MAG: DUF4301 family protein [Ignavibacteriaceae bacterium]|nr:DUF4301 family protein [Ignavibacteriaceae bacterium]
MKPDISKELKKINEILKKTGQNKVQESYLRFQLELFHHGIEYSNLLRPCKINDGIFRLDNWDENKLMKNFFEAADHSRLLKFVPASGAASRMFQSIELFLNEKIESKESEKFISNLHGFAFYDDLVLLLDKKGENLDELIENNPRKLIEFILYKDGLNLSNTPKGGIKFHRYGSESFTAFEEHLFEAIEYTIDKTNSARIHFTISREHEELFNKIISEFIKKNVKSSINLIVSHSFQKESTDTIAINPDFTPFMDEKEKILFRPAGHGALLENLNDLNADIVFIKNIDNITTRDANLKTNRYRKLMAGLLVQIQNQIFNYLNLLENNEHPGTKLEEIINFCSNVLNIQFPRDTARFDSKQIKEFLFKKLHRPIRVCGMVKNEGHPGGGPFWVMNKHSEVSLQIVEQTQVNLIDENQKNIFSASTHFNPTDLVCGVKDYKGKNFNLPDYRDPDTVIITKKSKNGKELLALELPGLWNGSMSDWNSIFVELPVSVFNPVKEVNDLLKPEHQG